MPHRVAVIDYGLGNLRSVEGAIERLDHVPVRATSPEQAEDCDQLVLPGVGAFADGMRKLAGRGWVDGLSRLVRDKGVPILGICLGAQLMAREGTESGRTPGLGWIDATVERLRPGPGHRVPHVGWNVCRPVRDVPLLTDVPEDALMYFTHSYHVQVEDPSCVVAVSEHGTPFTAAFRRDNVWGVQFHPEKSQRHGLQVLKNFIEGT